MADTGPASTLSFPFPVPPGPGEIVEVADGLLWARIALPFQLDHVNVYLIEDGDGYAVVDTGIGDAATMKAWEALADGPLKGRTLTRLIATHFHPDHIGLAGWLCERFGLDLLTSQTSYLTCLNISLSPGALEAQPYRDFYRRHGMSNEAAERVATQGHSYLRMVTPLPATFSRLVAGDSLTIGRRRFDILTGDGHAAEQLMLYCADERIFLAADQVLARISPNIGVWAVDPSGDPLGLYLRSLAALSRDIPADVLVLPGHQLPFVGLRTRCEELTRHHHERCQRIVEAAREAPSSVADLVPVVFERPLDAHQMSFAFSEVHAHVNRLVRAGDLVWSADPEGTARVVVG